MRVAVLLLLLVAASDVVRAGEGSPAASEGSSAESPRESGRMPEGDEGRSGTRESPGPEKPQEEQQDDTGIAVLPLIYYTPDTDFAFGVAGVYYFRLRGEASGEATRLSFIKLLVDYTLRRQLDSWGEWAVFLRDEEYVWKGELRYRNFPDRFYGLGNDTSRDAEERYAYDYASVKQLFLKRIRPNVFIGGDYQLSSYFDVTVAPGRLLDRAGITGARGGVSSGLGAVFLIDTRDNVVSAAKGEIVQASTYLYRSWLGSDFNFVSVNLLGAKYWTTYREQVLAVNLVANLNFGDPPLPALAAAGGDDILRGYAKNRFRDQHFVGAQAEYRIPIWWRIGAVVFAGVGDVFGRASDFAFSRLKPSVGLGLRGAYDPKERLNVRLDFAWGAGGESSFYIMFGEAF